MIEDILIGVWLGSASLGSIVLLMIHAYKKAAGYKPDDVLPSIAAVLWFLPLSILLAGGFGLFQLVTYPAVLLGRRSMRLQKEAEDRAQFEALSVDEIAEKMLRS